MQQMMRKIHFKRVISPCDHTVPCSGVTDNLHSTLLWHERRFVWYFWLLGRRSDGLGCAVTHSQEWWWEWKKQTIHSDQETPNPPEIFRFHLWNETKMQSRSTPTPHSKAGWHSANQICSIGLFKFLDHDDPNLQFITWHLNLTTPSCFVSMCSFNFFPTNVQPSSLQGLGFLCSFSPECLKRMCLAKELFLPVE